MFLIPQHPFLLSTVYHTTIICKVTFNIRVFRIFFLVFVFLIFICLFVLYRQPSALNDAGIVLSEKDDGPLKMEFVLALFFVLSVL